jgi:hypothetical protein
MISIDQRKLSFAKGYTLIEKSINRIYADDIKINKK